MGFLTFSQHCFSCHFSSAKCVNAQNTQTEQALPHTPQTVCYPINKQLCGSGLSESKYAYDTEHGGGTEKTTAPSDKGANADQPYKYLMYYVVQ